MSARNRIKYKLEKNLVIAKVMKPKFSYLDTSVQFFFYFFSYYLLLYQQTKEQESPSMLLFMIDEYIRPERAA